MMKKLVTLLLTVALCIPMFLTTSVEVRAEEEGAETYVCAHSNVGCSGQVDTEGAVCDDCVRSETPVYNQFELEGVKKHDVIYTCSKDGCDYVFETSSTECTYTDGVCVCGRTEIGEETTCSHEEYQEVYAYTVGKESEGHNLLKVCNSCDYVELVSNSNEPHEFNASGYCGKCGYNPNSSNNSKPSVSGNSVPKQETPSTPTYTEEEIAVQKAEAIAKATEELIKAEEAIPVTDFVSTEAVNAIPTELKENASTEAVFNVSKITTTRGFVAAVDKIVKDNAKERTVTLYSDKPFAFNATSLTAVADTSKDFVYMFKHEGQLYKVTIPAGAKVDLEGQMFAGPLFIGAKLGTTVVVK